MTTFSEPLRSTFATLARPLKPEDGEPEPSVAEAEARLGLRLPSVLRWYWDFLDRPGFQRRESRDLLLRRSGYPSDDRLHQGESGRKARSDLLTEDRNLSGGFDAETHVTVIQLHHRHDDPIVDHDALTEFAR
jgi:hypothetical protein